MESCFRCGRNEKEVKLFDAIYEGQIENICERCSILDNVPIIKKPNSSQLKESEKNVGVYQRMKQLTGYYADINKKNETLLRKDKLRELDLKPELEKPNNGKTDLVDHWYWHLQRVRRHRGLSQKQLGQAIGESEIVIQMAEKARLPENADELITKLEQFFQTSFRKRDVFKDLAILKARAKAERIGPVLLDEHGNEINVIPEPEIEIKLAKPEEENQSGLRLEMKSDKVIPGSPIVKEIKSVNIEFPDKYEDLDLRKIDTKNVKIGDLKTLDKKRLEVTKQEKLEEQRRIEERKRTVEARREEFRAQKEKQSRELDKFLGGSELLRRKSGRDERDDYLNL
jgi:ribosome-binding protein aMBF1 (putative translation factor)